MKRFDLNVRIEVSDDPFEAAEIVAKIKVPWYAMLQTLKNDGVKFEHNQVSVRAKHNDTQISTTKKQRRQQQRAQPQLVIGDQDVGSAQAPPPVAEDAPV